MKLSNKTRYGIRAVFDIAFHDRGQTSQIRDIAARQDIPPRFLEQIFQDLKKAGLVTSRRGPKGGYHLTRPANEIRLGDIVRALEGNVEISSSTAEESTSAAPPEQEVLETVFRELSERIEACLDSLTLDDLCQRGEALGLRRGVLRKYTYVI